MGVTVTHQPTLLPQSRQPDNLRQGRHTRWSLRIHSVLIKRFNRQFATDNDPRRYTMSNTKSMANHTFDFRWLICADSFYLRLQHEVVGERPVSDVFVNQELLL